jgi:hypothetical protein
VYLASDLQRLGAAFIGLSFDGSGQTDLGPRQVAKARALLGDQGDKLTAVGMHSAVYYDLVERKAIDYVTNTEARLATAATGASTINAVGGSIAAAYGGDNAVPLYMGLRVIVSDDWCLPAPTTRCISSPKALLPAVSKWVCRLKLIVTSSPRVMPCQSTCTIATTRLALSM